MEEASQKKVEDKIGELLLKGWIMLSESCSIETCGCPLLQNFNGQKYCCNCEMWVFDHQKKREKKKFTELVCVPNANQKQKEENKNKKREPEMSSGVLRLVLEDKLKYLTNALKDETDVHQIETIIQSINLILDANKKLDFFENK